MFRLTRGAPLSWTSLLGSIRPMDRVFTGMYQPKKHSPKFIGQIHQTPTMSGAHIHYVLPMEGPNSDDLVILLEGLIKEAGYWGANQVTADINLDSSLFPQFQRAGFSVLAKQRVYRCQEPEHSESITGIWRIWNSEDIPSMRRLYLTLVPPLIQPVEPLTRREMLGLVFFDSQGVLRAYADLVYGPVGIWILPIIHPQTEIPIDMVLAHLLLHLPDTNGRPIYLTSRSYQPWVESALDAMCADPGPEQALLIHYMALRQRVDADMSFATLENGKPEPTVPFTPIKNHPE